MADTLLAMISSATRDLKAHRAAALDACLRHKVLPRMMEHEPPADRDATRFSLELVDEADIYVLILGFRYGAVPPGGEKSYTHLELDHARATGKAMIVLLMSEDHDVKPGDIETGPGAEKVRVLRAQLAGEKVVQFFSSVEEMRGHLISDLAAVRERLPATAPRRSVAKREPTPPEPFRAHPYTLLRADEVVGRLTELDALKGWVADPASDLHAHRVLVLTAIGGMGKSTIAWKWFQDIAPSTPGLAGRAWWSFYDKGSRFDAFVLRTLAYVTGQPSAELRAVPASEQIDWLLDVLDRESYLVVLDGLERLLLAYSRPDAAHVADDEVDQAATQAVAEVRGVAASTGSFTGNARLRTATDPRVGSFLRRLPDLRASRVLITSRLYPRELQRPDGRPAPGSGPYFLAGLNDADAVALWRASECRGDHTQLIELFRSFGNYPLLIRALSAEVAGFRPAPGDYHTWRQVNPGFDPFRPDLLTADDRKSHVLEYALQGLTDVDRQVLQTVAAFTAPVTFATLGSLVVGPGNPVPDDVHLDRVLTALEDRGLLGWDRVGDRYDLHPVVRGVAFAGLDPAAQRGIYQRLADHFGSAPEFDKDVVTSLEDLSDQLERCHTLIRLGRMKEVLDLLLYDLWHPLIRIGAFATMTGMVESILRAPDWTRSFDNDEEAASSRQMLSAAIGVLSLLGADPARAADRLPLPETWRVTDEMERPGIAALHSLAHLQLGNLSSAERLARASVCSADETMHLAVLALGCVLLRLGEEAEGARWLADHRVDHRVTGGGATFLDGRSLVELGWCAVRRCDLSTAHELADRLAAAAEETRDVRATVAVAALRAAAARRSADQERAGRLLGEALTAAREARLMDEEIGVRTELAQWHLGGGALSEARAELLEAAEVAERSQLRLRHADALVLLSQVELAAGDRAAAVSAADRAYRLAWCDGGRYSYRPALDAARACLEAAGAPIPHDMPILLLPPPTPLQVEPRSLAQELRRLAAATQEEEVYRFSSALEGLRWAPLDPDLVVVLLDASVTAPSDEVRAEALASLTSVPIDAAVLRERLRDAMTDPSATVRSAAIPMLARTGDTGPVMAAAGGDVDPEVRRVAVATLPNLGGPGTDLVEHLGTGDPDPTVRAAALHALAALPDASARSTALLARCLVGDADHRVRVEAGALLIGLTPDAEELVRSAAVDDPDEIARAGLLLVLAGEGDSWDDWVRIVREDDDGWGLVASVRGVLPRAFLDERIATDPSLVVHVTALLMRADNAADLGQLVKLLIAIEHGPDLQLVSGAIAALGSPVLDAATADRLASLLERDPPADVRLRLARWLAEAGHPVGQAALTELLRGEDSTSRCDAVEMLACDLDPADHLLLTADLDGLRPYLDPVEQPIGTIDVEHAAEVTGETVAETRSRYERLAPQFRLELDWTPGPPPT